MSRRFQFSLDKVLAAMALVCGAAWAIHEIVSTGPNYRPSQFSLAAGTLVFCGAAVYRFGFARCVLIYVWIMGIALLAGLLIGIIGLLDLVF